MTAYVLYKYDPQTGHISGRTSGDIPDPTILLTLPNHVVTKEMIPASLTVTHDDGTEETHDAVVESGWDFQLDENGLPAIDEDGHYIVSPPVLIAPPPDMLTHVFLGMVKAGNIDLADVSPDIINSINRSLDVAGKPPLEGTKLVSLPTLRASAKSADIKIEVIKPLPPVG